MRSIHPGWCDPRYCRFTDIDIQHRSTPTLLSTCDHEWWFTLARADEWAHPQRHGDTELLIDVHNTILRAPDVQHVLRAQEIESYASRLLTERHRRSSSERRCCTTSRGRWPDHRLVIGRACLC
jgi:hypothetical protein